MTNYLLAGMKGRGSEICKVVSSRAALIGRTDLSDTRSYVSSYKLDDGEWFHLDEFSTRPFSNVLTSAAVSTTDLNQITAPKFDKIKYFCFLQGNFRIFQKAFPAQFIQRKWLTISDEPVLKTGEKIVILNDFVDAVYDQQLDRLYFKDVSRIKPIFKNIETIYREATQAEVNAFLQQDFISLTNGYGSQAVKTPNRKRIAMAMDTLNGFDPDDRTQIFSYIQQYCTDIPVINNTSFQIGDEEQLKKILWGIEERYYTTPLGNERRLANSVIAIEV